MGNLILLFLTEIIIFFMAFMVSDRDILSPSCTVTAMFVVGTAFAIGNISKWSIQYSFEAYSIIASGLFTFLITELIIKTIYGKKVSSNTASNVSRDVAKHIEMRTWVIVAFIAFNLATSLWYFREVRRIVGGASSIGLMFARYRNLGVDNLAGKTTETVGGILNQLLKVVKASGYVGVFILLKYLFFEVYRKKSKIILFVALIITSLIPNIMVASRGGILTFLADVLIVYYIIWHQKNGWWRNISMKIVRYGILAIALGIPLFYYSAFLMGRRNSLNIMDYVATYIGGPIQLFNLYVQSPIEANFFGEESLVGIHKVLEVLGIGKASTSYNLESRMLGNIGSNVYTFFRRPLHDFGLIGMYVFTILVALLFCYIYYKKIKNRDRDKNVDIWVLIYGYLFYWLILSPIDQYSQSYVSLGAVLTILIIVLLFKMVTSVRIVFRRRQ